MSIEMVYESDKRQSVSKADVIGMEAANKDRLARGEDPKPVPPAGIYCGKDEKHGRMLMSLKSGFLECGICGYQVAAPKD